MNHSESITALAAALAKAQAAIQPAIKDKTNPAFRSKYADLGAVWEACRKPLTDNGLSVVQLPASAGAGQIALTTMLLHTSGEYLSETLVMPLAKNDPQGVGSALTYARRYALAAIVGVVADEDDDGNAASKTQSREASYQPAQQQQPTNGGAPGEASEKQYKMIFGISRSWGWSNEDVVTFAQEHGINIASLRALTSRQASDLITALKAAEETANAPAS